MQNVENIFEMPCEIVRNTTFRRVAEKFLVETKNPVGFVLYGATCLRALVLEQIGAGYEACRPLVISCDIDYLAKTKKLTWGDLPMGLVLDLDVKLSRNSKAIGEAAKLLRNTGYGTVVGICAVSQHYLPDGAERALNKHFLNVPYGEPFDYFVKFPIILG